MASLRTLPPELTIYGVAALRTQWLATLPKRIAARPREQVVDASTVVDVDGAGVQLLVALQTALAARGRQLRLVSPSRPLAGAIAALGLGPLLLGSGEST